MEIVLQFGSKCDTSAIYGKTADTEINWRKRPFANWMKLSIALFKNTANIPSRRHDGFTDDADDGDGCGYGEAMNDRQVRAK